MTDMSAESQVHATRIEFEDAPPTEIPVGSDIALQIKVTCCAGCDLDGAQIDVTLADGDLTTLRASGCEGGEGVVTVTLKAPQTVGQHAWSVACPAQDIAGIRHEGSAASISITTHPHATSLAAWAMPAHVTAGERFAIKVGAKSSADCPLHGQAVEIFDQAGVLATRGILQSTPWPGTSGLYWTQVELDAPANVGIASWSVRFAPQALASAHDGSSSQFHVAVVSAPAHTVTVKVVEKESVTPVADVQVRLGAYRGVTDESGLAQLRVGKGRYDLHLWKVGYEAPPRTIDIEQDVAIAVETSALPPEDPDAIWEM
ncbi:MAG TPA: hypothetical protein VH684_14045 [Xanthobacteraceae bacterium]|jgi:hypothetical protein